MELSKHYNPSETENKWYCYWLEKKYFQSTPDDREPFTVVIPPPNVTGILHMGHMLNNTIQDILVRRARMQGKNACWVPGTDHASIATEAKVVQMLRERGIKKSDLSREEFLKYAWEWKEKHGGIILEQLKKLGASCDWERTRFTMEDDLYDAVIEVFIDLYKKGRIYRGVRMVNWDPVAKTALSDEEVIHKEVHSRLYYIKYQLEENKKEFITVATTRPETILGDVAICVNPKDKRYKKLKGKKVLVPLINRAIPVIEDDYVDMEFGTGCLKVTPAHDINDYEIGKKYNLEVIDVLNEDGTLSEKAQLYVGKDRFIVRKEIAVELEKKGHISKIEDIINKVGYSERTDAVIEPRLSLQWFLKMKDISKPAIENVLNDTIKFHPEKLKNTYRHWMENVKDWCISRQLWWGQRIPAWYYGKGPEDYVVAKTIEEALKLAREKTQNLKPAWPAGRLETRNLTQDEDVLDTWFSSWLWPISVFDGFKDPNNKDINYYYPTNVLVTGHDIMFFWVARMIIAGYEYKNEKPFHNVYFTGMVRDKQGRKMSKSLGNSPDILKLIEQYGADALRAGVLFSSPAGNDLLFDEKQCEQGRNFCNKIWNAFKLVKGWEIENSKLEKQSAAAVAIKWFEAKLNERIALIDEYYNTFKISDALMAIYKLIWDDFCSWYLEMIKPGSDKKISKEAYDTTILFFEQLMKLLHPFMPFITEEVWQQLNEKNKDSIMISSWPKAGKSDNTVIRQGEITQQIISNLRNIRTESNIKFKDAIGLIIQTDNKKDYQFFEKVISKLANVETISYNTQNGGNPVYRTGRYKRFLISTDEFFVPVNIDMEAEKQKLLKELDYNQGFLKSVQAKLSNERFVHNAPEQVVATEKKKMEDAQAKIKMLKENLAKLN